MTPARLVLCLVLLSHCHLEGGTAGKRCKSDAHCAAGQVCQDGACVEGTPAPDVCGDDTQGPSEACDDGNQITESECAYGVPTCQLCDATCDNVLELAGRTCGDDNQDPEEQCDDGNQIAETECPYGTASCERCDATCQAVLNLSGGVCGDSSQDPEEACDDGFTDPCGTCNATCDGVGTGHTCGDGEICPELEACDDANSEAGEGCDDDCALESSWVCSGAPSVCHVTSCVAFPDMTPCDLVTNPDRSYDVCLEGLCQSPGCGDATCNVPGPYFPLPDTNQRACFDATAAAACPSMSSCESTAFCGQDAQYGWDLSHATSEHFTVSATGEPTVKDEVTGLIWQGCEAGANGTTCLGGAAQAMAWSDAVAYCDGLTWSGVGDWRLPSHQELLTIVDFGSFAPAIRLAAFPATPSASFWTITTWATDPTMAWAMNFNVGENLTPLKTDATLHVRCVRDPRRGPWPAARRTATVPVTDEPVVSDAMTGLTWQGCVGGLSGAACDTGSFVTGGWEANLAFCEDLDWGGFADWRLPDVHELASITDVRRQSRALDALFVNTPANFAHSATTRVNIPSSTYGYNLNNGKLVNYSKGLPYAVRCVRGP